MVAAERVAQAGPRVRPLSFFFFNDTATTEIYTLSLHDALPISRSSAADDTDRPSATRTPPPTSVAHVKSSCRVWVKSHPQASSGLASVAKYENPPAQNP